MEGSTCSFIKLGGGKCKNKVLTGEKFCGMPSHTADNSNKNKNINYLGQILEISFTANTLDSEEYRLVDVMGDDACLFRSLAVGVFEHIDEIGYSDMIKRIIVHPKSSIKDGKLHIKDQTELARRLQRVALNWIVMNKDKSLDCIGGEKIGDVAVNTHELEDFDEYFAYYSIFAGDVNYVFGDNGGKLKIPPRWGGYPEMVAISEVLDVDIQVYVPRKLNSKKNKVIPSYHIKAGTRFELYSTTGGNAGCSGGGAGGAGGTGGRPCINLLLIDKVAKPHYNLMIG